MHLGGDDDENQDLIAKLEAEAGAEEQHAFVIGAGEMEAPADLLNATNEALPESYSIPEGDLPAGEEVPAGDFGHFGSLGGAGESHISAAEDPFAQAFPAANEALGADLAAATDAGLAGELGELEGLGNLSDLENLNDVDGILAAALPDGGFPLAELELPSSTGDTPTFQVQIEADDPALKARLKELAAAQGIQLTPAAWEYAMPVLSQLTEYQAVLFQKEARSLGARVKASVNFPVPQPSEDDLALGDLASIPEPAEVRSEGAPSVALPKRMSEVLLFTGELLPGFTILETKGPVTAHRRIARRMFRNEEVAAKMKRELDRASGRSAAPADSHLQLLFREIFVDLQKQALKLGANAVLSLRVEFFAETAALDPSSAELRLLVIGTAAVVETA